MLLSRRYGPLGYALRPRLRDGASGAPPALQGRPRFTDSGTDCGRYIRPLVASVEAGPDDDSLPGASRLAECLRHPRRLIRFISWVTLTRFQQLVRSGRWDRSCVACGRPPQTAPPSAPVYARAWRDHASSRGPTWINSPARQLQRVRMI